MQIELSRIHKVKAHNRVNTGFWNPTLIVSQDENVEIRELYAERRMVTESLAERIGVLCTASSWGPN